ncbi:MAG: universal stress protein [Actinomycetia bacterium]|nr:universal stress protein [Actinomycetes bacterium]
MTVVVGYLVGRDSDAALRLAAETATTFQAGLAVATVVPRPWTTPSPARVDAEYAQYADRLASDSAAQAKECIEALGHGLQTSYHKVANRSVSGGLLNAVSELNAEVLVLGSASEGTPGRISVGSTSDRLLHSSPVPLAISPHGYHGSATGSLTRISCAYPARSDGIELVKSVVALGLRLNLPVRVLTFAVRGRTMYPPEVGLHAEDSILQVWASQAREALANLRTDGVVGDDIACQVVMGNDWGEALDAAGWHDGEILALGTARREPIARVFLGSRGSKIVRHSPVPVLVLPA